MSDDPMDQGDEDNDEFFSARETQRLLGGPQRSDRETSPNAARGNNADSSPSERKSKASKRSTRQQTFVSDEKAQHSDKSGKLRREKNKGDRRDNKKAELEPSPCKKNKKEIKPKRVSTEEASKTDEESELDNTGTRAPSQTRPYFQQPSFILNSRTERPIAPKCSFHTLRFKTSLELVEFDGVGDQVQHNKYPERAITNPWRRWGAHRTLCEQGGYIVGQTKNPIRVEKGSAFPPCPPDSCQVTLNRNSEIPSSQSLFGTILVQPGPAVPEGHRIGRVVEDMVQRGGFVPKKAVVRGQPMVVVQKGKKKKKTKEKKGKKKGKQPQSSSTDSSDTTEEESGGCAEKPVKKTKDQPKIKDQEVKDDSKKGGGGAFSFFFRRNKSPKKPPKASGSKDQRRKPKGKT